MTKARKTTPATTPQPNSTQQPPMTATDKVGIAAGVGGAIMSGAGGTTVTTCPPEDNSFYCKFVKGFNIFKMLLVILAVIIGVVMLYYFFKK